MADNERVDYSELIQAVKQGNRSKQNRLLEEIRSRLMDFMAHNMNVPQFVADDVVQEVLIRTLEAIEEDKIDRPKAILAYMIQGIRNEYYNYRRKAVRHEEDPEDDSEEDLDPDKQFSDSDQHQDVLDEERLDVMRHCIEQLKPKDRNFLKTVLDFPDMSLRKIAKIAKVSYAHARVKKHRLSERVSDCVNMFFKNDSR